MDAAAGGETEEGFGEGGVVMASGLVLGDTDVVGVGAEMQSEIGEGGAVPCGDVEGGLQEEGNQACFVGLVGGGSIANGGFEGVVAAFHSDADDAVDQVAEVEVTSKSVFQHFAHIAGGIEVGGVDSEEQPAVGGPALGNGGVGGEEQEEERKE